MAPLDLRKYLFDILQACDLLVQFTAGKTFFDYSTLRRRRHPAHHPLGPPDHRTRSLVP